MAAEAILHLQNKFDHINPDVLFEEDVYAKGKFYPRTFNIFEEVIENDRQLARTFGIAEKGYARLSMLSDAAFHMLFPGAELECFSSPLSSHITNYCSLSDKTGLLGSKGDIMRYNIVESNLAAHPPNNNNVVVLFIDKIRQQKRRQHITLRLFVPDWENIDILFGDFANHITSRKYFTRAEITASKMMMNGDPRKFLKPWTPLKDRVLITFEIPANHVDSIAYIKKNVWVARLDSVPEVEPVSSIKEESPLPSYITTVTDRAPATHEEHVELAVRMLTGISDPIMKAKGDALYHQLIISYSAFEYPLEDVADLKKQCARTNLMTYVQQFLPQLSCFESLSIPNQSDALRQAISIATSYGQQIESKELLNVLLAIYDQWVDCWVSDEKMQLLYTLWLQFESKILAHFANEVCHHLTAIDRNKIHLECLGSCPLSDLVMPTCHTTGITYINPLSIVTFDAETKNGDRMLIVAEDPISKFQGKVDGILYIANVMSDFILVDNIIDFSSDKFTSLVIVSHDIDAGLDIIARHPESVMIEGMFNKCRAYYVFVISKYQTVSTDQSINKIDDIIDFTDIISLYKLSPTNVSFIHAAQDVYKDKWLWFNNDFAWTMKPIIRYMSIAFYERTVAKDMPAFNSLRGARALHWAISRISDSLRLLQLKHEFAIAHPLITHCGGDGVDLYLNQAPHSLSTLLFMHEQFDSPLNFPGYMRMNMLDRKTMKIAKLLFVGKFTSRAVLNVGNPDRLNEETLTPYVMPEDTIGDYACTSYVAAYKWTHKLKSFHNYCRLQADLDLLNVFVYQAFNVKTQKYIVIQVLHVWNRHVVNERTFHTGHFLQFYLPHDRTARYQTEITKRFITPYLKNNKVTQLTTLVYQMLNTVDLREPGKKYFPNIHVEREVVNNEYGVNLDNYYSMFDSNQGLLDLKEFMDDLLEKRKFRLKPFDYTIRRTQEEMREYHDTLSRYEELQVPFGAVNKMLNEYLKDTYVQGWGIEVVGVVPPWYFDLFREMSRGEVTLYGAPINFQTARVYHDGAIVYPCPGSNFVWNCRLGHLLSAAATRVSRITNQHSRAMDVNEWWGDNVREEPNVHQYEELFSVDREKGFLLCPSSFSKSSHIRSDPSKLCRPLIARTQNAQYYETFYDDVDDDGSDLDFGEHARVIGDDVEWGRDHGML